MKHDNVITMRGTVFEQGYGLLPQKAMRDKRLKSTAKTIYAYICSFANTNDSGERSAFPGVAIMCNELDISEDTFYKHRKSLIDLGYLTIEKRRKEGSKFDNNLYIIEAVITEKPAPPKEKKPHPKKQGMEKKPYPNFPGTEKPRTEKTGTNITRFKITRSNTNSFKNQDQNQDLTPAIFDLKLPMALRQYFKDKVKVLVQDSFNIFDVESFYNQMQPDFISPDCSPQDALYLNDFEFTALVKAAHKNARRPIQSTTGLLRSWTLSAIAYKMENNSEGDYTSGSLDNWLETK